MEDRSLLEARLADLADVVARLEGRVAALERAGSQGRRSAAQAALDRSAAPSRRAQGAFDAGEATRILSLGGRTLLVLAGAFVLRAVTDSGSIPSWMGVGLGFVYAGAWMVMADRAGKAGQTLSAAFHAVSVVIIGFPLLIEGTNRFKLFSPAGSAAVVLTALTAAALLLATRRGLPSLAWVVSLGGNGHRALAHGHLEGCSSPGRSTWWRWGPPRSGSATSGTGRASAGRWRWSPTWWSCIVAVKAGDRMTNEGPGAGAARAVGARGPLPGILRDPHPLHGAQGGALRDDPGRRGDHGRHRWRGVGGHPLRARAGRVRGQLGRLRRGLLRGGLRLRGAPPEDQGELLLLHLDRAGVPPLRDRPASRRASEVDALGRARGPLRLAGAPAEEPDASAPTRPSTPSRPPPEAGSSPGPSRPSSWAARSGGAPRPRPPPSSSPSR